MPTAIMRIPRASHTLMTSTNIATTTTIMTMTTATISRMITLTMITITATAAATRMPPRRRTRTRTSTTTHTPAMTTATITTPPPRPRTAARSHRHRPERHVRGDRIRLRFPRQLDRADGRRRPQSVGRIGPDAGLGRRHPGQAHAQGTLYLRPAQHVDDGRAVQLHGADGHLRRDRVGSRAAAAAPEPGGRRGGVGGGGHRHRRQRFLGLAVRRRQQGRHQYPRRLPAHGGRRGDLLRRAGGWLDRDVYRLVVARSAGQRGHRGDDRAGHLVAAARVAQHDAGGGARQRRRGQGGRFPARPSRRAGGARPAHLVDEYHRDGADGAPGDAVRLSGRRDDGRHQRRAETDLRHPPQHAADRDGHHAARVLPATRPRLSAAMRAWWRPQCAPPPRAARRPRPYSSPAYKAVLR